MPKQGADLLCHPELVFVPSPQDAFIGSDGKQHRVRWVSGFIPRAHCFIVRVARFETAMGRLIDNEGTYAAIRHEGDGTWREIDL